MKKETSVKKELEVLLKELQEQKASWDKVGVPTSMYDIVCVKRVIELIEQRDVDIEAKELPHDEKLDLDKYDRISGSEWNETLEKKVL